MCRQCDFLICYIFFDPKWVLTARAKHLQGVIVLAIPDKEKISTNRFECEMLRHACQRYCRIERHRSNPNHQGEPIAMLSL